MSGFVLTPPADRRLDDIYRYTADCWGADQAATYIEGLFAEFAAIAAQQVLWRPVPGGLGLAGFRRRWRSHIIYWREVAGRVEVVSILHVSQDQAHRLRDDLL
jgi:toxin ParE1/3/4